MVCSVMRSQLGVVDETIRYRSVGFGDRTLLIDEGQRECRSSLMGISSSYILYFTFTVCSWPFALSVA